MSYLNNLSVSRGIRNHNPGNLVYTPNNAWLGKIPYAQNKDANKHFEQFTEMKFGVRAMMRDIISDIKKGKNTIATFIHEYAPKFENNTSNYITVVSKLSGIAPNAVIDLTEKNIIGLCKAMVIMENGTTAAKYVTDADYSAAVAILGIELKKK